MSSPSQQSSPLGNATRVVIGGLIAFALFMATGALAGRCNGVSFGHDPPGEVPDFVRKSGDPSYDDLPDGGIKFGDELELDQDGGGQ